MSRKLPFDWMLTEGGVADNAVLLSDRTIQLALAAIDWYQNRYAWEETTDSEWDDVDKYIGEAITELLTEQGTTLQTQRVEARRLTTQSLPATTDTAIIWTAGDFDTTNPTRLYFPISGLAIISVNVEITYTVASTPQIWLRFNGLSQTDVAKERSDASLSLHFFNETWTQDVVAGQYVECFINPAAQAATLQAGAGHIAPRFAAAIVGS